VCQGSNIGNNGFSWTVLVYVLDSQHNDVLPTDEDPIPQNSNQCPVPDTHGPHIGSATPL